MILRWRRLGFPSPPPDGCRKSQSRVAARGLGYERFSGEAKLTYVRLNTQTPCPPRGAVPVDQGCGREFFTSNWEKTLGTTPGGQARQDVFLVALKVTSK
jgi:hypothetical protein